MVTLIQKSLVLTYAAETINERPLISLVLLDRLPLPLVSCGCSRPASRGTQTVASTVQDLALPSVPSEDNCSGSSLQTASNHCSFRSPERAETSPPPLAPQPGQPEVSCMRLRLLLTATRGRAIYWPFGEVVPGPRSRKDALAVIPGAEILSLLSWAQI